MNIKSKGQSLMELVMILPVIVAFWAALAGFAQIIIISIELMHTARHGAFWLAYSPVHRSPEQEIRLVKKECMAFLSSQAPGLDTNRIIWTIHPGDRWQAPGPRTLLDIPDLFTWLPRLRKTLKEAAGLVHFRPAEITLAYPWEPPRLLRFLPGFPSTFLLRGHCAVYR